MIGRALATILAAGCFSPAGAAADESLAIGTSPQTRAEISVGTSYLTGQSHELVYDPFTGEKISELIWDLNDVVLLGAKMALESDNGLSVHLRVDAAVAGQGYMEDYDWRGRDIGYHDWTDVSWHDDTDLDAYVAVDARFGARVFKKKGLSLHLMGGLASRIMKWTAYGGEYLYSAGTINSSADLYIASGTFPNVPVIEYQQIFQYPYAGLGFAARGSRLSLETALLGAPFVKGSDTDHHLLRALRFDDETYGARMIGAEAALAYQATERVSFEAQARYEAILEGRGPTVLTDMLTGDAFLIGGDASGMDHQSLQLGLSIGYRY